MTIITWWPLNPNGLVSRSGCGAAKTRNFLQLQLGSPPVSPLGIVPDCISSSHPIIIIFHYCIALKHDQSISSPDPLGDRPVLLSLLGQDALHPEGLQGRHGAHKNL